MNSCFYARQSDGRNEMLQPYRFRSPQRARKLREWRAGDILGESVTVRWRVVSEDDCLLLVSIRNDAVSRRYIRRRAMPATPGTHLAARRQHPASSGGSSSSSSQPASPRYILCSPLLVGVLARARITTRSADYMINWDWHFSRIMTT